jgi:hypothetical protein
VNQFAQPADCFGSPARDIFCFVLNRNYVDQFVHSLVSCIFVS